MRLVERVIEIPSQGHEGPFGHAERLAQFLNEAFVKSPK